MPGSTGMTRRGARHAHQRLGQPIGEPVPGWTARPRPPLTPMQGRTCRTEPLDPARHGADLWQAVSLDRDGRNWTYLAYGPFAAERGLPRVAGVHGRQGRSAVPHDPRGADRQAVGVASYLRIDPPVGVIEVGHIHYSPALQRTPLATEAMYLMMARVFDELGYRRYEWKCDSLNAPSRRAAERFGFRFEGIFRQATLYKGRNRDTAWYSIIDSEWPAAKAAYEAWLAPENFDAEGKQKRKLEASRS